MACFSRHRQERNPQRKALATPELCASFKTGQAAGLDMLVDILVDILVAGALLSRNGMPSGPEGLGSVVPRFRGPIRALSTARAARTALAGRSCRLGNETRSQHQIPQIPCVHALVWYRQDSDRTSSRDVVFLSLLFIVCLFVCVCFKPQRAQSDSGRLPLLQLEGDSPSHVPAPLSLSKTGHFAMSKRLPPRKPPGFDWSISEPHEK